MNTLGHLLGSTARTDILRVLSYDVGPIGLRPLARLAGVHPRSAELALRTLVGEGLVLRRQAGKRPVYERNEGHPEADVLQSIFQAAALARVRQLSKELQTRARGILPRRRSLSLSPSACRLASFARRIWRAARCSPSAGRARLRA